MVDQHVVNSKEFNQSTLVKTIRGFTFSQYYKKPILLFDDRMKPASVQWIFKERTFHNWDVIALSLGS